MANQSPAQTYFEKSHVLLHAVEAQLPQIQKAADWFAQSILAGRMVHVFGSGHSRIMVEEMWPRYGSFPGFNPIVELSLSFHNLVVGANGQRQAMFLENVAGLADRILRNFAHRTDRFSIGDLVERLQHCANRNGGDFSKAWHESGRDRQPQAFGRQISKHPFGKKLQDFADLVLDTGAPVGDAMVSCRGWIRRFRRGRRSVAACLVNAIKAEVAARMVAAGQPPRVLTASAVVGADRATALFESAYDEHAHRLARLYAAAGTNTL